MKKGLMTTLGIIAVIVIALYSFFGGNYNNLVSADEGVKAAWGQVENQYQRRLDLIDNLVATVKGFADQELEVFTEVVEARAKATATNINIDDAEQLAAFQSQQGELSSALSRLLVSVEAYPELKSDQNFLELQAQLEGTENRIATARQDFGRAVLVYNKLVRQFPSNIVAMITGFDMANQFSAEEGAEKAPKVDFGKTIEAAKDVVEDSIDAAAVVAE